MRDHLERCAGMNAEVDTLEKWAEKIAAEINAKLAEMGPAGVCMPKIIAEDLVERMLPAGWSFVWSTPIGGPHQIALTTYTPPAFR